MLGKVFAFHSERWSATSRFSKRWNLLLLSPSFLQGLNLGLRIDHVSILETTLEGIVFKEALFLYFAVLFKQFPYSVLNSCFPLPFIPCLIFPDHDPIPIPFIILEFTFILSSIVPMKDALSMFHIIQVKPFITVCSFLITFHPFSFSMFQAVFELSSVLTCVCPGVLTKTRKLSFLEISNVSISICKLV